MKLRDKDTQHGSTGGGNDSQHGGDNLLRRTAGRFALTPALSPEERVEHHLPSREIEQRRIGGQRRPPNLPATTQAPAYASCACSTPRRDVPASPAICTGEGRGEGQSPSHFAVLILFLAITHSLSAASPDSIQRVILDDRVVVTVPVATNRVTTISFPGPISAIDAAGVSADPKVPGQFQLAHTAGSSFLSVRAAARKAATNLNLRWNKKTYVFELIESDAPVLALQMDAPPNPTARQPAAVVSPHRLLALLDKAKAFPLLKQQHPDAVAQVEARTFGPHPQVTDFDDMEIRLHEIFRFNPEDTLVFHLTLKNKCDDEIRYNPDYLTVRVGNRLYYQSMSDAPGVLPPKAESTVYLAITGTPDGGRNDLSVKNEFTVLLRREAPALPLNRHDNP